MINSSKLGTNFSHGYNGPIKSGPATNRQSIPTNNYDECSEANTTDELTEETDVTKTGDSNRCKLKNRSLAEFSISTTDTYTENLNGHDLQDQYQNQNPYVIVNAKISPPGKQSTPNLDDRRMQSNQKSIDKRLKRTDLGMDRFGKVGENLPGLLEHKVQTNYALPQFESTASGSLISKIVFCFIQ